MAHDYTERLQLTNILGKLQPHVDNKELSYALMGDEWIKFDTGPTTKTPWLIHKGVKGHQCHLYHGVYHGVFECVPKTCFSQCWKLTACNKGVKDNVVQQLTMEEVLAIEKVQQYLDMPSKCGMDRRAYTPNLWGSYWYFPTLYLAQRRFNQIKGVLNSVNPDINVQIKRSCTEFELALGPSDQWDTLDKPWTEIEDVLDEWVWRTDAEPPTQHELIKRKVRLEMMYWAHQHGDFTYKKFNRGNDLVYRFPEERCEPIIPSVTYNP